MEFAKLIAIPLSFLGKDGLKLLLTYILCLFLAVIRIASPLFVGVLINGLQTRGLSGIQFNIIYLYSYVAFFFIRLILRPIVTALQYNLAKSLENRFAEHLSAKILKAPLSWHDANTSADVASRLKQSSSAVLNLSISQYTYLEAFLLIIGPILIIWHLSPLVCAVMCISLLIISAFCVGFDFYQRQFWNAENDAIRRYDVILQDVLRNVTPFITTRQQMKAMSFLKESRDATYRAGFKNIFLSDLKWSTVDVVSTALSFGLVTLYVSELASRNYHASPVLPFGNLFIVMTYAQGGVAAALSLVTSISGTIRNITNFEACAPIVYAPTIAEVEWKANGGWKRLNISDLEYKYASNGSVREVLKNVNVDINIGKKYALIGVNGSGKSTFLKVLSGLLPVDVGTFSIDDRQVPSTAMTNMSTLIPQSAELMGGTIADNLFLDMQALGALDNRTTSFLDTLLCHLSTDFASPIDEGGANWSGGQRQRINLARGVVASRGASLVLIDEPTASIDAENERRILEALLSYFDGSAIIIALHCLEMLVFFDEIIFISPRGTVECGTVNDLLLHNTDFAAMMSATTLH